MGERGAFGVNRREFLLQGAAATAALAAGSRLGLGGARRPAVVIVRDRSQTAIQGFRVDAAIVQRLVDRAVMTLAGRDDVAKAWATFVGPRDRIAIKFNGLFDRATTHGEVVTAITNGLAQVGVDPANIVVYDRADADVARTGLRLNREGPGIRIHGNPQYGDEVRAGRVSTRLSRVLLGADVLINVPVLKSHSRCAVTGALKNHLGSVPNAGAFHDECCAAIADLNALAPIKDKTRICIADALYCIYNGGPTFNARARWDYHGVMASVDPVAMDAVMDEMVRAKRVEAGLQPRMNANTHITRAAELGLGEANLANIQRTEVEI